MLFSDGIFGNAVIRQMFYKKGFDYPSCRTIECFYQLFVPIRQQFVNTHMAERQTKKTCEQVATCSGTSNT